MLCKKPVESRQLLLGQKGVFVWGRGVLVGWLVVFKENLHTRGNSRPVYVTSVPMSPICNGHKEFGKSV